MAESQAVRQKAPGALVLDSRIEERLKDVTGRIVDAFAPQRIILFGSHAYGQPNSDSDVDLLVVMESDERPAARATRVSRLLRPRPFPMDIVVRTPQEIQERLESGDYFMREVLERGRVLYERGV
ncbi:MAG: nucleotidyltransferase domain-containing protein [Anaerolineae bacterium]|jgi:predicted nucleotidyltransferase